MPPLPAPPPGADQAVGRPVNVTEERRERAALICAAEYRQLMWTASNALFEQNRAYAEDLVADLICDVVTGRFPRLPNTPLQVIAFAKCVLRNRAMHVNRDAALLVSVPGDEVGMSRSSDPWLRDPALRQRIRSALSRLPARERQVAVLHWVEGHTVPSVARQLGIAPRTVKELARRGRRKLRNDLAAARSSGAWRFEQRHLYRGPLGRP